ncbi:MAG: ATP-binding cassette domain-containing protein [Caulobacter sp.]
MSKAATYINQINAGECGAACLNTVLTMRGAPGFLNKARYERLISAEGSTLLDIKKMAEAEGATCEAHFVELDALAKLPLPAILHWNFNHFVVLLEIGSRYVVFDPAVGRMRLDAEQFSASFTGYCLVFPGKGATAPSPPRPPLRLPSAMVAPTLLLSAAISGLTILLAAFPGLLFRFLNASSVLLMALLAASAFAGVALIRFLCTHLMTDMLGRTVDAAGRRERAEITERFARIPFLIGEAADTDEITGVLSRRLGNIDRLLRLRMEQPVAAFLIVAATIALICFSPPLAAIALGAAGAACAAKLLLQKRHEMDANTAKSATGWAHAVLQENLRHADTLRSSGAGAQRFELWRGRDDHFRVLQLQGAMQREGTEHLADLIRSVAYLGFSLTNVLAVVTGVYGWPVMVSLAALFHLLFDAVLKLAAALAEQARIEQENLALDTLFPATAEAGAPPAFAPPQDPDVAMSLDRVAFRRRKGARPVFENLSLEVRKGERIAIMGRSGAGKSTLVKLLAGLYPADEGVVGRAADITEKDALFLFQDLAVFKGSILENVSNFSSEADEARAWEALDRVGLRPVVQGLPLKLETVVSPRGPLSSGQLQRLSLARAVYLRPRLLVMDESTSHLDADTEARVMQALREVVPTIIYVGHRPGILNLMDRVLVLEAEGLKRLSKQPNPVVNAAVRA